MPEDPTYKDCGQNDSVGQVLKHINIRKIQIFLVIL